jgi:hypothetical protein
VAWSSVDRSAEPDPLIDYLDSAAVGLAAGATAADARLTNALPASAT